MAFLAIKENKESSCSIVYITIPLNKLTDYKLYNFYEVMNQHTTGHHSSPLLLMSLICLYDTELSRFYCNEIVFEFRREKVKGAVSKKDEALSQTQQKLQAAIARCQHLEELIDRQHRDLIENRKKK